jgi:hypothetical protein
MMLPPERNELVERDLGKKAASDFEFFSSELASDFELHREEGKRAVQRRGSWGSETTSGPIRPNFGKCGGCSR